MLAKYPGWCVKCKERILAGKDYIERDEQLGKFVHTKCPDRNRYGAQVRKPANPSDLLQAAVTAAPVDNGATVPKESVEPVVEAPEKPFVPSKYQIAVFDFITKGEGNAVVEAVAGSGKTTTIVKALDLTSTDSSVAFLAFNKHIADELRRRAPKHVQVSTLHALGFKEINATAGHRVEVDEDKLSPELDKYWPIDRRIPIADRLANRAARNIMRHLISLAKAILLDINDTIAISEACERYGIDMMGGDQQFMSLLPVFLDKSREDINVVDFDDMIWLPLVLDLQMTKYDWVFVDECLPYQTPILLADGTSLPIGQIVDNKADIYVKSYNTVTNKQENCRVIGWHKIVNQKPLVKVKVKRVGSGSPCNFVTCTVDHKVWTSEGWIQAGELKPGIVVQVETSARKSQIYKITTTGRKVVSSTMSKKNRTVIKKHIPSEWLGDIGGNGKKLPIPQAELLNVLGAGWESEYPISTKLVGGRGNGFPTCYKVDIANPSEKIAIEVDGKSHVGRIKLDNKKDDCLKSMGWTVIRFTNDYIMHNLDKVVATVKEDCPKDATVVSVEPVVIKDWYVYDIDVEKCHDFYANGILVHNCQDMNASQIELIKRIIKPKTGRIIAVGDRKQSLYGFRGADTDAIPRLIRELDATILPLSISYRCPISHVAAAKMLVPQLEHSSTAKEGLISHITEKQFENMLAPGDMVMCRTNAPLVGPAFRVIRKGIKACIRGRDIGAQLVNMIDKFQTESRDTFHVVLEEYYQKETDRLLRGHKEMQAMALQDKVETLMLISGDCVTDQVQEIRDKLMAIFSDEITAVVFSSVHRAKGLEATRVFILRPDLMPHPKAEQDWEKEQEQNCLYVSMTRSKDELYYVDKQTY